MAAMTDRERLLREIGKLLEGMKVLEVPILVTEQYPKGLGPTASALAGSMGEAEKIEKLTFSCCGSDKFWELLFQLKRKQVVVTGMETHVCVLQTVLDLLANDYQVHVPAPATCSRHEEDRQNALRRMERAGAVLTNTESVLFELLRRAGTDEFKAVQKIILASEAK